MAASSVQRDRQPPNCRGRTSISSRCRLRPPLLLGDSRRLVVVGLLLLVAILLYRDARTATTNKSAERVVPYHAGPAAASDAFESASLASRQSTEATDRAARAASDLVDTLDAARDAADGLRRVAAAAAHKKRVADRAAAVAATAAVAMKEKSEEGSSKAPTTIATVRERRVVLDDGTEAQFSVFGRSDEDVSVFILPYDTRRKVFTLVEEFHPGPNRKMIGLVAGMYEPKHGGSPRKAAVWELSEEARLKLGDGSRLVPLASEAEGGFSQDKYSSAHFRPFIALDCVDDGRPRPRDREESIKVRSDISVDNLRALIKDGKLNIPSTAFAMMGLKWLDDNDLL